MANTRKKDTKEPTSVESEADVLRTLVQGEDAPSPASPETLPVDDPWALETMEILLKSLDRRGDNVRKQMDPGDLEALQESLRQYGMLEPVLVEPIVGKTHGYRYRLIAGFRRATAAQNLGWKAVPARVLARALTPEEIVAVQLTENLQREHMHLRDVIAAVTQLREQGRSMVDVAKALGFGESTVRLYAQVGDVLHRYPKLWPYFDRGLISLDHFRAATRLMSRVRQKAKQVNDPQAQQKIAEQAEVVFVAMLERLAKTQPLTVRRVSAEVANLLRRAGLEDPNEVPQTAAPVAGQIVPAVLTGYDHLDVTKLSTPDLERLIELSEKKLDAAKAVLERRADAS
jgi:ParB/RepB/Spo0J family partition protein